MLEMMIDRFGDGAVLALVGAAVGVLFGGSALAITSINALDYSNSICSNTRPAFLVASSSNVSRFA